MAKPEDQTQLAKPQAPTGAPSGAGATQQPARAQASPRPAEEPETAPEPKDDGSPTHILVRSRRAPGFNRAGRRFGLEFEAIALSTLTDDELRRIEGEPMLDTKRVHQDELAKVAHRKKAFLDDDATRERLVEVLTEVHERLESVERDNRQLREDFEQLRKGDRPPRRGEDVQGLRG